MNDNMNLITSVIFHEKHISKRSTMYYFLEQNFAKICYAINRKNDHTKKKKLYLKEICSIISPYFYQYL